MVCIVFMVFLMVFMVFYGLHCVFAKTIKKTIKTLSKTIKTIKFKISASQIWPRSGPGLAQVGSGPSNSDDFSIRS